MSFEQTKEIITLYIDSASTLIQLSCGAIAFSVAFSEKLSGAHALKEKNYALVSSWILFLLAIGFGAFYQYCAIKLLDSRTDNPGSSGLVPAVFLRSPGKIYAAMMFSFFGGAVLFVVHALIRLRKVYYRKT